jgi:hypothetical protein
MKVHPASDTVEFTSTVDGAMRKAFNICLSVDLLDALGHTCSYALDPSLTHVELRFGSVWVLQFVL